MVVDGRIEISELLAQRGWRRGARLFAGGVHQRNGTQTSDPEHQWLIDGFHLTFGGIDRRRHGWVCSRRYYSSMSVGRRRVIEGAELRPAR